jgi:hypothetical protein
MFSACGIAASRLTTQTFSSNATWTAPGTTLRIESMTGVGAPGVAAYTDPTGWQETYTTTYVRRDNGPNDVVASTGNPVYDGSAKPNNYCDPVQYYTTAQSTVYSSGQTCYSFATVGGAFHPATTGASTTGFGKTFPGGTGGAGTNTTFTNVAVTPGSNYSVVVPSGGSLTINYYK